ncbi:MAG: GNAT family N-acetyltransferase [Leptolyngbyaceae bacterium]|nr:GNAT family N-acetyltransferase [Leptolyngbyaceae bacterium]
MTDQLHLEVVSSDALSDSDRRDIITMCNRAYEEELEPLFNTFGTATHVLGYSAQSLVSHAMWVTRWLQVDTQPLMRTAYIEMVATDAAYRNRGFATAVMKRVASEIQGFDLGALSPFSVTYYARLGWEPWQGPLFIRTDDGLLATPSDEEVMILRLPQTPILDVHSCLSAEWREGELW